jgi:hypothetical protein
MARDDGVARKTLRSAFSSGAAAGAAGVTALNAVTYLDMAIRARPPSRTPQQAVEKSANKIGFSIPGGEGPKENRLQGLGPLAGIAAGLTAGIGTALVRRWRPSIRFVMTAAVAGVTAMVVSDGPMAALGVTDPREWSAGDWIADAVPHLGYGIVTAAVLDAFLWRSSPRRSAASEGQLRHLPSHRAAPAT